MLEIELCNVTKVFRVPGRAGEKLAAVDDVSCTIHKGEIFFLLGPSGCGKTTLLRILAGLVEPTAGRVLLDGTDATAWPTEKRRLPMVFQNYALWPHMTVAANVAFGPTAAHRPRRQRRRAVADALALVDMADHGRYKPPQLSGGQQQRVALARALAVQPRGLLLDEPLSNLDARLRTRMRGEIRRIVKDSGATAVYVTHDQEEALSMADRIAVMDAGRIAQVGTPQEVYHRPASRFVADFLGEANFLVATVAGRDRRHLALDTPAGRILAAGGEDLAEGAALTCCIRPEAVRVGHQAAPEAENRLTGRVVDATYLGPATRYRVALGSGETLEATALGTTSDLAPGRQVEVRFSAGDVVLLADVVRRRV